MASPVRVSDDSRSVLRIPKVRAFLDRLIEGEPLKDAAKASGMRVRRARSILQVPEVRRAYVKGVEGVVVGEHGRNTLLRIAARDRGLEPGATAAATKVALLAADRLDGIDGRPSGPNIAVGVSVTNVVGYVMDLREDVEEPRPMIDASPVRVEPRPDRARDRAPRERTFFESTSEPFEPRVNPEISGGGFEDLRERGRGPRGFAAKVRGPTPLLDELRDREHARDRRGMILRDPEGREGV